MVRLSCIVLRIERAVLSAELATIVAGLAAILVAVGAGIVDRTFALPWPDLSEIALIGMSVIAFIGGAYAVHAKAHISLDAVDMLAGPSLKRFLSLAVDIAIVVFSLAILRFGAPFMSYVLDIGERTPELELPIAFPVGCLMAGAALSIFHVLCGLLPRGETNRVFAVAGDAS